jgi:hypothetical protein
VTSGADSRTKPAAWNLGTLASVFGVGPAWVEVMVADPDFPAAILTDPPLWSPPEVAAWERRHHAAAATSRVRAVDLRMVALRLAGLPPPVIAARVGVHVQTVRTRLRVVGLQLALTPARPGDGASRRQLRDGYPPDTGLPHATGQRVRRLWLAGATWPAIAEATGYTPAALRDRAARSGHELPPRWNAPAVRAYLGWSHSHIYQQSRQATMCPPDGVDEHRRRWWWPSTVTTWAQSLPACPVCGARVERLTQHSRRHANQN